MPVLLTEKDVLGIEAAMHLAGLMQRVRQRTDRTDDGLASRFVQLGPSFQPSVQIHPTIQCAGQENCTPFAINLALPEEAGLKRRHAKLRITTDIAKLLAKVGSPNGVPWCGSDDCSAAWR